MSEEAPVDTFAEGTVKREVLIDVKTKETWLADVAKSISSTMFLVHPMKNDVPKVCVEEPLRREALSNVQMLGVPLTIPYNVRRAYAMAYAEDEKGLPTLLLLTGYDSTEGTAVEWTTSKMWHFHRPASLALLSLVRHANVNGNEEAYPRTLKLISGWIAAKSKGKHFAHTPANRERLGQAMNNVRLLYLTKETDYKDRGVVQSRGEDWELVKQAAAWVESEHWAPKAAKKLELNGAGKKHGAGAGASTSTSKKVESDSDSDDSDMSKPLSKSVAEKAAATNPAAAKPAAAKPAASKPAPAKAALAKAATAKPKPAVENGKGGMGGKLAKMKAAAPAPPPPRAPSLVVDGADHKKPLTKKKLAREAMEEAEEDALAVAENEADGMFPDHDEVDYEDESDVESENEDARMAAEYEMSVRDTKKKKKETELRNVGSEDDGEEGEEEEEDEEAKSNMETGDEEEESESEESESEESETAEEKTEESGSASDSSEDVDSGDSSRVVKKKGAARKKAIASDGEDMDVDCGLLTAVPVDNLKSSLKGSKRKRKAIEESEDEDEHFDEDGDDDGGEGGTTAATKRIRSNPTRERQAIDVVGKAAIAVVKGSEQTEQMKEEAMQVLDMYVKTGKRMEEYQLIKTIFGLLRTSAEDKSEGRSLSEEMSFMEARMAVNKKIMKMQEESMIAVAAVAKSVAAASAAADNAMQAMNVTALGVATSVEAMKVDAEA